jgi:hypothetical protein
MKENKPIVASIQPKFIGKKDIYKKQSKFGWQNVELSHADFEGCLKKGYAHGHQWHEGTRLSDNFMASTVISVDFDKGNIKLDTLLDNPFIKQSASFVYTSSSHSEVNHRFHVLFVLPSRAVSIEDLKIINRGIYKKLANSFQFANYTDIVDTSVDNPASFLFGSPNSIRLSQEVFLTFKQMDEIRKLGVNTFSQVKEASDKPPAISKFIDAKMQVQQPNSKYISLDLLNIKDRIRCPFHIPDKHASAFVIESGNKVRGIHCRTCNKSWFTGPTPPEKYDFFKIDELIRRNSGQINSNYKFQGIAEIFPEVDANPYKSNYHVTNKKHLESIPTNSGIHLIKSPKGSGKTTALINLVINAKFKPSIFEKKGRIPVILIGHRQALIREMSEKLGLTCYLDSGSSDRWLKLEQVDGKLAYRSQKPREYAICLDSLHSRMRLDAEDYPIVIIDESEQEFSHLLSDSMEHPYKNFETLATLIGRASHVYCLDADLGEITVDGILNCLKINRQRNSYNSVIDSTEHNSSIHFHLNEYKKPAGKLNIISQQFEIYGQIISSIKNNKKCFVTSNSKKIAETLYLSISKQFPDKKFLCITSNNSGDENIRDHVKNIKETVLEYDAVFSSPSLGTGIDITYPDNAEIVDCVYGIFLNSVNTHFDIDQQLARVRHPKEVNVWISNKNTEHITNSSIIRQDLLDEYDIAPEIRTIDQDGIVYSNNEHSFLNLLSKIRQIRYESQNNFRENFISYKKWQGWNIYEPSLNEDMYKLGKIIHSSGTKQLKMNYQEQILNARLISEKECFDISLKRQKNDPKDPISSPEKTLLEKYWLQKTYKCEVTKELLDLDKNGQFRKALQIYETLVHDEIELIKSKRDISTSAILNTKSNVIKAMHNIEQAYALKKAFVAAGIYKNGKFLPDAKWSQNSLSEFILLCKDNYYKAEISRLFNIDIGQKNLSNRASRQLTNFLQLAGLTGVQVTKNRGDGKSFSSYSICPKRLKLINEITARRIQVNSLDGKQAIDNEDEF